MQTEAVSVAGRSDVAADPAPFDDATVAPAREPPLRIRVQPVSGAQVVGWLLRLEQLAEGGTVRLESFDEDTAIVAVDPPALGTLIRMLVQEGQPLPAIELLSGPTDTAAQAPAAPAATVLAPVRDGNVEPSAGPAPPRRSRRLLRFAALVVGAALAAAAGFAGGWLLWGEDEDRSRIDPPAIDLTATISPAPVAAPSPSTPARARLARDLTGACIPEPGTSRCDAVRTALWAGDPTAWREWATRRGEPLPAPAEVAGRAIGLRLAASDPAARIAFARASNAPLPMIAALYLEWDGGRATLLGVEIANLGVRGVELSGGGVPGVGSLSGVTLGPGDRCAVGLAMEAPACAGTTGAVPQGIASGERVRLIGADAQELDHVIVP